MAVAAQESSLLYLEYMDSDRSGEVPGILDAWISKSGMSEPVLRAYILYAVKYSKYSDSILPENIIDYIYLYNDRAGMVGGMDPMAYNADPGRYGYIPPGEAFDDYTFSLAASLKETHTPGSPEYFWADFYSGGHAKTFGMIKEGNMPVKKVAERYDAEIKKYMDMGEYHFSLGAGAWIPTGDLWAVGIHPEIGLRVGWKQRKMNYDFSVAVKFLEAGKPYRAYNDYSGDAVYYTQTFFGAYVGFDVGYDIWRKDNKELQITGGIGYDMFNALKKSSEHYRINPMNAYSGYVGIGVSYRWYVNDNTYMGLRLKYNFADYPPSKIVRYKGHVITLQFMVGILGNSGRNKVLNALEHPYRQY